MNASPALDGFGVEGFGVVQIPHPELASFRKNPGASSKVSLGPVLRNADEQSVLAVGAVLRAIEKSGWQDRDFDGWAVLAAPRYLGRARVASCWDKFNRNGVRGVSPWAIPNISLHAVAGTVSLAIQSHGPNFGLGGSGGHLCEAFDALSGLLSGSELPGLWLVLTEWSPEAITDERGEIANAPIGYGVALAIARFGESSRFQLASRSLRLASAIAEPTLEDLARFLTQEGTEDHWACPLADGYFEIARRAAAAQPWSGRLAG